MFFVSGKSNHGLKDFKTYFLFILEINKKQVLKAIRSLEFHKLYLKNLKKSIRAF